MQVIRQKAVKAISDGFSVRDVAKIFGVTKKSTYQWLALVASGGQNALLAKPIPGAPTKLTAEQMKWVADAVRNNTHH